MSDLAARIDAVLLDVRKELLSAMTKHPPMHSPHEGHSVIREELDVELWEHVTKDTGRSSAARAEAIQVAAMGARYALDLCGDAAAEDERLHARAKGQFIDDGCPGGPGVCPNGKCRGMNICVNETARNRESSRTSPFEP
jgi:hypothetical protein